MSQNIAAIDVHKKLLVVVIADSAKPDVPLQSHKFGHAAAELSHLLSWPSQYEVVECEGFSGVSKVRCDNDKTGRVPGYTGGRKMSVKIDIADGLYKRASKVAAEEGVSVDALFAAAFEQRLVEIERLQAKASRGNYQKFQQVMSKAPAVEPAEDDRLY